MSGLARHAKARDENEPEIVEALRRAGASVHRLDTPCDLLVGIAGQNHLIEVKKPRKHRGTYEPLTAHQIRFRESWQGEPFEVVTTIEEALEWATRKKKRKR